MKLIQDIPPLSDSIWPYDTGKTPDTSPPGQFNKFRCFVLCPFERSEIVMFMVHQAIGPLKGLLNHDIEPIYAGDIGGARAIHPDIWGHIKQADVLVADVTGYNPNVLYELGVAAAWRPIETVIIIRDESDNQKFAFDLQPARQIIYDSRTQGWMDKLKNYLQRDIIQCFTRLPFRDEPTTPITLPFEFSFESSRDTSAIWSPGPSHRRLTVGGLEFGSPFYFPYSWLSPVGLRAAKIRVRAEIRFDYRVEPCWIGVCLRSQGYLATHGHLVWICSDGTVWRTSPGEGGDGKEEHKIGSLSPFDLSRQQYFGFDIRIDDKVWSIKIDAFQIEIPLSNLPYVFSQGRILFQAFKCRAVVKNMCIDSV